MGGKPKPPKHPGESPARSGDREIIWEGSQLGGSIDSTDTRIIAIDKNSSDNIPCQVIIEYRKTDGMGNIVWREPSAYTDMTQLEKKLVLEVAALNKTLPWWATKEGLQRQKDELTKWLRDVEVFKEYEQKQRDEPCSRYVSNRASRDPSCATCGKEEFDHQSNDDVPPPKDNDHTRPKQAAETRGRSMSPSTFVVGDTVKVRFKVDPPVDKCEGERMWVKVTKIANNHKEAAGVLDSDPVVRTDLKAGDIVTFDLANVLEVWRDDA